ncbi:hypothetical protein ECE50_007630 [Chitinophaga sp. Mgbs1]|uniref:Uncharacterized protein n=1 Tax=Chitinophaga solisilvae TaxID=1233460 RepID=A0A3S1DIF5_9BACT|nr:hypothetical protein [Chitinophaga solisilvae]
MKNKLFPAPLLLMAGLGGYLFLLLLTVYHQQAPLFDEPLFIPNVYLFEKYGLSREFLVNIDNQAPGPLYQFVHIIFKPLTHMQTPGIRLVNVALLGLTILVLAAAIMRMQAKDFRTALLPALNIMAIPMIWQVSGMALTEIPPVFFAALSVLLIYIALQRSVITGSLLALLGGLCLGLSILGRSPFLVIVPASAVLLLYHFQDRRRWLLLFLYNAVALAMCVPVFLIWQGLMPPRQAITGAGGIDIWHGILAFAYGALLVIIIAPSWFIFNRKTGWYLLITYFILLAANVTLLHYSYSPLSEALDKILPAKAMQLYPFIISPLLATVAIYFIVCSLLRAWQRREDVFFLFILFSGMLLLASSFKVTHLFSSRYVAQAAPFIVLALAPYDKITYGKVLRFGMGMVIGLLSLETYFHFR